MRIRDIMSPKVVSIAADDTLWVVKEIMESGETRHLPVVRQGRLVGVVSQRDLLSASLSNVMGIPASDQRVFLENVRISEVMSAPPISIGPDAPVEEAARTLAERKIGCLPVVERDALIGIVTETDVLRYFAGAVG